MSKKNELINNHYRLHYIKLVKRTQRRVPNNSLALAEEVVQEAYRRALEYFRTYNPKQTVFDTWFGSILRNTTNQCRAEEQEHGASHDLSNTENIIPSKEDKHIIPILHANIAGIKNERDRNILHLFYIAGFKSKDISQYMGINHNNVRQIILRFKNKINDISPRDD